MKFFYSTIVAVWVSYCNAFFCPVLVLFAFYKPLQLTMLNSFFIAFVCSSLHIICISVAFRRWAWMLRKRNSHKDCMRWSFRRAVTTSTIIRGNSKMFISLCSISHLSYDVFLSLYIPSVLFCLFIYDFFCLGKESLLTHLCVHVYPVQSHDKRIFVYHKIT